MNIESPGTWIKYEEELLCNCVEHTMGNLASVPT
jgi:hypothetical protein